MRPASRLEHPEEELQALRCLIRDLAPRCGFDIDDRNSVRQFLDNAHAKRPDPRLCLELHAMLILLFRLEASSSEDLGVEGLGRLWRQHGEIMTRYGQHAH